MLFHSYFFCPVTDCPCGKRRSSSSVSKSLAQRSLGSCYPAQHYRAYIDREDYVNIYLHINGIIYSEYIQVYIPLHVYMYKSWPFRNLFVSQPSQDWLISTKTTWIINILLWIILVHFTIYFHQGELLWYFGVSLTKVQERSGKSVVSWGWYAMIKPMASIRKHT